MPPGGRLLALEPAPIVGLFVHDQTSDNEPPLWPQTVTQALADAGLLKPRTSICGCGSRPLDSDRVPKLPCGGPGRTDACAAWIATITAAQRHPDCTSTAAARLHRSSSSSLTKLSRAEAERVC